MNKEMHSKLKLKHSLFNLIILHLIVELIQSGNIIVTTAKQLNKNDGNYFETIYKQPNFYGRNAVKFDKYKWPNATIPYQFNSDYTNDERSLVYKALEIFHQKTCVKFIEYSKFLKNNGGNSNSNYVKLLKSKSGCGALVGYRPPPSSSSSSQSSESKPTEIYLSDFCLSLPGGIQHEFIHVLGVFHEQSRYDRDDYIEIIWDNIQDEYKGNFLKVPKNVADGYGLPYDYKSLMHYPNDAFVKKGANFTMISKKDPKMQLGQVKGPSKIDLEKIRRLYNC